jgi:hypothetical protein
MKVCYVLSIVIALSLVDASLHNVLRGTRALDNDTHRSLQIQGFVGAVGRWRLINATIGNVGQVLIDNIINGTIVDMTNYPLNQQFSIEAVTSNTSGPVNSVRFMFANKVNFRTDSVVPYSLCGDISKNVYRPCIQLVEGTHTIAATPYSLVNATGVKGEQSKVSFTILRTILTPSPSSYPSSYPSMEPTLPTFTTARWIEVNPNAPINARHEACFVMVGRKAYLLLGRGKQAVNIYDPVTRTWTNGTAPPIQIHHTQCVAVNNSIWIVSSWTGGYPMEKNTDKIYVSNCSDDFRIDNQKTKLH